MLVAGKSAMLRWAAKVAAHAVTTSGRGATAAGLMASAVKDASTGSWGLEAGAFVLADGGLCCLVGASWCPGQLDLALMRMPHGSLCAYLEPSALKLQRLLYIVR